LEAVVAGDALAALHDAEAIRLDALDRLARAAEYRDDNTPEHTRRVGALAARLARRLGLPDRLTRLVRRAAPLHDLGKIAIPDSILLKPGRLEPEELAVVQTHAVLGARVLEGGGAEVFEVAERIVRSHHERWDGGGYPDKLAGEEIPLGARIIAVCDAFEAMVEDRPWRTPISAPEALAELRRCAGSQFDPRLVEVFAKEIYAEVVEPGVIPPASAAVA
jgi:putative two-component system response regulator